MSPIIKRVTTALETPTGYIVPSGVGLFKKTVSGPEAATAFLGWRKQRFTKNLYLALQDMIIHQPPEVHHNDIMVQYGITLGLTLAAQLVSDPSVIWPDIFGPGMTTVPEPDQPVHEDFQTTMDDALDEF